jgi:hypothetical protein
VTSENPWPRAEVRQVDSDTIEQVLLDYSALRRHNADPELEAVRTAILIEDVFGVTLSDVHIDPAVLADVPAVAALVVRLQGAV